MPRKLPLWRRALAARRDRREIVNFEVMGKTLRSGSRRPLQPRVLPVVRPATAPTPDLSAPPSPPEQAKPPEQADERSGAMPAPVHLRIYQWLVRRGAYGATDEEMQQELGLNPSTQRPRRVELVRRGLVVDAGHRRATRRGREATVWRALPPDRLDERARATLLRWNGGQAGP